MTLAQMIALMKEHSAAQQRQSEPLRVPARLEDIMQDNMPGFEVEVNRAG